MSRRTLIALLTAAGLFGYSAVDPSTPRAQGPAGRIAVVPGNLDILDSDQSPQQHQPVTPNAEMVKEFERASELISQSKYALAVEVLQQQILDGPEDSFIDSTMHGTYKTRAIDLIGSLPSAGRRAYEVQYGTIARQMLNAALADGSASAMEEVSRRFFHTEAGYEATYRLGCYYMDHSMSLAAARAFERLRAQPAATNPWEPAISLRAALCWKRAGSPERSLGILRELRNVAAASQVALGGDPSHAFQRADDALEWLLSRFGRDDESALKGVAGWPMLHGNPGRYASALPASTEWDDEWDVPTVRQSDANDTEHMLVTAAAEAKLRQLAAQRQESESPLLPAAQPIVVGDLVIFRTLQSITAVDLHTGRLQWETATVDETFEALLNRYANSRNSGAGGVNDAQTIMSMFLEQRAYHDLTAGTLSSDGEHVFAVEAAGFLSPYQITGIRSPFVPGAEAHSKIRAYDLKSGKLKWEVGGQRGDFELELAGMFFLGPPLPIDNRLYCLVESSGEIGIAVLDPETGRPERDPKSGQIRWQPLLTPGPSLSNFPTRRQSGISPSYADGILVCPTAGGAAVAVDIHNDVLLWGYRYSVAASAEWVEQRIMRRWLGRQIWDTEEDTTGWLDSSPCLVRGRVLLTPRDSDELHCVRLTDGDLLWKRPRGQGLFLGCVDEQAVVVVEQNQVQAFSLVDGRPLWNEPTPIETPAGRGVRSDHVYYLPLTNGEIVTIDIRNGRILATAKSRNGWIHGNLVAAGGALVSQTPAALIGFRPLDVLEKQVAEALAKDPADPSALALRGRMQLHQGHVDVGLDDLRRAYSLDPDPGTRDTIVAVLLQGLRLDFQKYRGSIGEIARLADRPETQSAYLRAYANGLEKAGENEAAFAEYLKLAEVRPRDSQLDRVSGSLSVRGDRWVRGRINALYGKASADERANMDHVFHDKLNEAAAEEGPQSLRSFLNHFAGIPLTTDAIRQLVDRLKDDENSLELETRLRWLMQTNEPPLAGFATARLASLMIGLDQADQLEELLARLEDEWSDVSCLNGKTGREIVKAWRADDQTSAKFPRRTIWPSKRVQAEQTASQQTLQPRRHIEIIGSQEPFFGGWNFSLEFGRNRRYFIGQDGEGRERWKLSIDPPQRFTNETNDYAQINGHVMMLVLTNQIVVLDLLDDASAPRVLWVDELEAGGPDQAQFGAGIVVRPALLSETQSASLTAELVCYQKGSKLYAADPFTGKYLWIRSNVSSESEIFADGQYVFAVEPSGRTVMVLSAEDGREIATRPVPDADFRLARAGRHLLLWKMVEGRGGLAAIDILDGSTRWQRPFDSVSAMTRVGNDEFAVLESDGSFVVLGIEDGQPRLTARVNHETLENELDSEIYVLKSRDHYVLLTSGPVVNRALVGMFGGWAEGPIINGHAIGFDRKTQRQLWVQKIDAQSINLHQPPDLPVLVFASRVRSGEQPGYRAPYLSVLVLDKRNGKIVYNGESSDLVAGYQIDANPARQQINVDFYRSSLSLRFTDDPGGEDAKESPIETPSKSTAPDE